jgi:hypothetical protein
MLDGDRIRILRARFFASDSVSRQQQLADSGKYGSHGSQRNISYPAGHFRQAHRNRPPFGIPGTHETVFRMTS